MTLRGMLAAIWFALVLSSLADEMQDLTHAEKEVEDLGEWDVDGEMQSPTASPTPSQAPTFSTDVTIQRSQDYLNAECMTNTFLQAEAHCSSIQLPEHCDGSVHDWYCPPSFPKVCGTEHGAPLQNSCLDIKKGDIDQTFPAFCCSWDRDTNSCGFDAQEAELGALSNGIGGQRCPPAVRYWRIVISAAMSSIQDQVSVTELAFIDSAGNLLQGVEEATGNVYQVATAFVAGGYGATGYGATLSPTPTPPGMGNVVVPSGTSSTPLSAGYANGGDWVSTDDHAAGANGYSGYGASPTPSGGYGGYGYGGYGYGARRERTYREKRQELQDQVDRKARLGEVTPQDGDAVSLDADGRVDPLKESEGYGASQQDGDAQAMLDEAGIMALLHDGEYEGSDQKIHCGNPLPCIVQYRFDSHVGPAGVRFALGNGYNRSPKKVRVEYSLNGGSMWHKYGEYTVGPGQVPGYSQADKRWLDRFLPVNSTIPGGQGYAASSADAGDVPG